MKTPRFEIWRIVTIAVGAVLIVTGLACAGVGLDDGSVSDLPAWLEGVSTLAAVVAASAAAIYAAGAFQLETQREDRFVDAQRRHQAERVAAWHVLRRSVSDPTERPLAFAPSTNVVRARNASDLPVTSATFVLQFGDEMIGAQELAVLPPSTEPMDVPLERELIIALQGARERFTPDFPGHPPPVAIDLAFTDAAGQRWRRTAAGSLSEVD